MPAILAIVSKAVFEEDARVHGVSATPNTLPVTNITHLRRTIAFESGKGTSQDKGTLGMSLQTPRALTPADVAQILATVEGRPAAPPAPHLATSASAKEKKARVIDEKYEILRQLGQGGMGAVYEARHLRTGRHVALKEIDPLEIHGLSGVGGEVAFAISSRDRR